VKASVVIPAYNAAATLDACLEACANQTTPPHEIIVVDDGSTDDTADRARAHEGVTVIEQPNAGPAGARNAGAHAATGDIVVYTDADCLPEPECLTELLRGFDADVYGVGGTYGIANPDAVLARLIHAEILLRHARLPEEVDFLGSFNVAYRRDALEAAGGFDDTFRQASGEDNDLAYRLHDAGGKLRFQREAVVRHYHPDKLIPYLRTQRRHGFWRMKLYAKHPGRSGGDHYAGLTDLAGPPSALLVMLLAPVLLAAGIATNMPGPAILICLVLTLLQSLLHFPKTLAPGLALRPWERMLFHEVITLRDYARALGLVHGVFTFLLFRRETPA
jgi:glycosyltransferase involved in cell wall biosynthesis